MSRDKKTKGKERQHKTTQQTPKGAKTEKAGGRQERHAKKQELSRQKRISQQVHKPQRPARPVYENNESEQQVSLPAAESIIGLTVSGKLSKHRDGFGFLPRPDGGEDLYLSRVELRFCQHGDIITARVSRQFPGGRCEAELVSIDEHALTRVVGRFRSNGRGGMIETQRTDDIWVREGNEAGAVTGDMVTAQITMYPDAYGGCLEARVQKVLGKPGTPELEMQATAFRFGLPLEFSEKALQEAEAIADVPSSEDKKGRHDLTKHFIVTIDGEHSRDFDDAVCVIRQKSGYKLLVSIADVAHYVTENSALDQDALERGTSVYFPERCIPMLPEKLSNGICSLNPDVERLTMTAEIDFDDSGAPVASSFYNSVIRSAARLTYQQAAAILAGEECESPLKEQVLGMGELALLLEARRRQQGSLDFDLPEAEIRYDAEGNMIEIVKSERTAAHRLIEQFMLAANEAVATFFAKKERPSLYRVHEQPDPQKLAEFAEFAAGFGYQFSAGNSAAASRSAISALLKEVDGKLEQRLFNELLLRSLKTARYSADNTGHYGLASPFYSHFTSPIRRYPDLELHRLLKSALLGQKESTLPHLTQLAEHCSNRERVATQAERDMVKLKKTEFASQRIGTRHAAVITGVVNGGLFLELSQLFLDGFLPTEALPRDQYQYEERQHVLVGRNNGIRYRIGDPLDVIIAAADSAERSITFALAPPLQ